MPPQTAQPPLLLLSPSGEFRPDGQETITVGRHADATVHVDHDLVSGLHLMLSVEDGTWVVRNRSSRGAWIDGKRVETIAVAGPTSLRLGDPESGPLLEIRPDAAARDRTRAAPIIRGGRSQPAAGTRGRLSQTHRTLTTGIRLGRADDCDLVVDDPLVSRYHAELRLQPEGYELVDLGSHNGTFLNGRRVDRARLEELDIVEIGHHSFRLVGSRLEQYVDEGAITFRASGLSVRGNGGRTLLDDVTIALDERSLLGVVGPSGAGKSTLLNALTGFKPASEGQVLYNGRDLYADYEALKARIGFVPQEDIVHPTLTVRQSLDYAAELRFPADVGSEERARRVAEVIDELGLTGCADVAVGSLSGGQRRRVSVGTELITKPSLLFLDEPTSGLDPGRERELMELLRALADDGRTVVVVTHSVQSLRLCDRVLFLAPGGRGAYFGPAQLALAYFGREDLQEVFRDLSASNAGDWSARFRQHPDYQRFVGGRTGRPALEPADHEARAPVGAAPRRWLSQFWLLTRRYWRVMTSDRRNLFLLALQPPLLGLLMLAALPAHELSPPPVGELRIVSRAGLVLLVVVLGVTWLGASNAVREIAKETAILRRERAVGLSPAAYVASKAVVLSALVVLQAAVLVPIAVARQGGPATGSVLGSPMLELVVVCALAGIAGTALGLLISAFAGSVDRAMTILPVLLIFLMLLAMGGLFPDLVDKPVLKQASYAASTQWGFSAAASTVDLDRLQSVDRLARDVPSVRLNDTRPALDALARDSEVDWRWRHETYAWLKDTAALVALSVIFLVGAVFAVRRRRPEA